MKRPYPLVAVCLAAIAGLWAASSAEARDPVRELGVPNVVGQDLSQAVARLGALGLEADVRWSAEAPKNRVSAQQPRPGASVPRGSRVELTVGLPLAIETLVPDVVGLPAEQAVAGLEPVYVVEVEEVPAGRRHHGRVVAQDPEAGKRLPFRGGIRIAVGRRGIETERVPLPSVVGKNLQEAEQALLDRGLIPYPEFVPAAGQPAWSVLKQAPSAATLATPGTRVTLRVAADRSFRGRFRLPSLYGLDVASATRVVLSLGLRAQFDRQPSAFDRDTVIRQSPEPHVRMHGASPVRLTVAYPAPPYRVPRQVAVPHLRGKSLADAWREIREAGLQLEVRRQPVAEHPAGGVARQRPQAGVRVPLGSVVRVDVPLDAEVPRLVGLRADEARQRAEEAGFEVHLEGPAGPAGGRVVDQAPEAGTRAAMGTAIRVVLRRPRQRGARVPDVVGLTAKAAARRLEESGFQPQLEGPFLPLQGLTEVVSQSPQAGARARPGSSVQVRFRVRTPPDGPVVRVPDLTGRSLRAAQRLLSERGLEGRATFVSGGGRPGVTGQNPPAGRLVRRGSEVRFTIRR